MKTSLFSRLSVSQVARELRMSARKVRQLIVSGPLVGSRINGRLYVEAADLERFRRRSLSAEVAHG